MHAMESTGLKRDQFYEGPKRLEDRWMLKRDQLTMRCMLSTHRLGWELKLASGAGFLRSHVCKSEGEVTSVSEAWQAEAKLKGWS
jgi:hypothetical protein